MIDLRLYNCNIFIKFYKHQHVTLISVTNIPLALTFSDVLLKPQYSEITSRSQVNLETNITPRLKIKLPIISINMDCVTGIALAKEMARLGAISFYPRFAPPPQQAHEVKEILDAGFNVIPAVGIKEFEAARVDLLVSVGVKAITIDIAHGHLKSCSDFIKAVKQKYPDLEIIAGVVGTYEGARDLFKSGADSVRVGVGPGTICTTRITTGCGVPQMTAVMDAFRAAQEFKKPILADGGTKNSGDIVKALAAGGHAVVVGSQLAGAAEAPGEIIEINGKQYKTYNASTSKTEKLKQFAKNSTDKTPDYVDYVEGIESYVDFQGPLSNVLGRLEKGIRSGFSYCGAHDIEELHAKAQFMQVTTAVISENANRGVTPATCLVK